MVSLVSSGEVKFRHAFEKCVVVKYGLLAGKHLYELDEKEVSERGI